MQPKEAVQVAKLYVNDLFGTEQIQNVGLEELEYDSDTGTWLVTLGFSRPWTVRQKLNAMAGNFGIDEKRDYKIVRVADADGRVLSIKNRQAA